MSITNFCSRKTFCITQKDFGVPKKITLVFCIPKKSFCTPKKSHPTNKVAGATCVARGAGVQGGAKHWHRFHFETASFHRCQMGAVGKIQSSWQANEEDPRQVVSPAAAAGEDDRAASSGKGKPLRISVTGSMTRSCSVPRCRRAWASAVELSSVRRQRFRLTPSPSPQPCDVTF